MSLIWNINVLTRAWSGSSGRGSFYSLFVGTEGGEALQNITIIICQIFVKNREVTYPFVAEKIVGSRLTMPWLKIGLSGRL